MSMVQCFTCSHFRLKDAGKMAVLGFGCCQRKQKHEFYSATYPRECAAFIAAPKAVADERDKFLNQTKEATE